MPKLSVIVPVYNTEKYLRECIDSILDQTFTDFELILVDDGSTDSSGAICDEYADKDPRIQVIHQVNGGITVARKSGVRAARGEYVTFVDSDDWIDKDMYRIMLAGESADVVICNMIRFTSDGVFEIKCCVNPAEYDKQKLKDSFYPTMKKCVFIFASVLLIFGLLVGCGNSSDVETTATEVLATEQPTVSTEASVPEQTTVPNETEAEEDIVYEGDASSYYIDVAYSEQIGRYYTALSEKWDEGKYFENNMSALPYYYYEGNPLENVGFGFADLDNDGHWELIIGAILNAEKDPAVFEIWTLVDGEPVMLAQGGSRNRYVLQYVEEDRMWYVVNEGSNGAANSATYYLMLNEGKLEVMQGIVFDAVADEENPWFMTYDLDWDTSNDEPIDEVTAVAILESNRKMYTALELFPYIFY